MKRRLLIVCTFAFFTWLAWACGIADAFVGEDIESIEDPKERAWAWEMEHYYQGHGDYPDSATRVTMRANFEARWAADHPQENKTDSAAPQPKRRKKKMNDTANPAPPPNIPPADSLPPAPA